MENIVENYRVFLYKKFPYASEGSPARDEIDMFVKSLEEMLESNSV